MHDRVCYLHGVGGDAHRHTHTRRDCHLPGDTRMHTARSAATGQNARANAHARAPLTHRTRVACPHARRQLRYPPRHAHAHAERRACHPHATRPRRLRYLYWQEVPLPSWQRRLCSPARRAQQSPSARASPSSALSSRAVGRALPPAESGTSVSPPHAAPHAGAPATQSPILCARGGGGGGRLPLPSPRSRAAGPLSWLPPTPGLSQVGGAQPRSQWQCPWLLHTWVGDTEPQPPLRQVPTSGTPTPPRAPHSPHARGICSGTAGHPARRRPGTGAGDTPIGGWGCHHPVSPPVPFLPPRHSPSRGRRRCRAAPYPHR